MEITVSVVNFRSLSQSDLIMRNLYSLVQVGTTLHAAGSGVLIQGAKFHSGTVENPLVIMLKNSQTETMMYVRNIPMSAVLGRRGPFEQWVAVYPPGDPQNLHFDAAVMPKEGCPQVLISVLIEEDISPTRSLPTSAQSLHSLAVSPVGGPSTMSQRTEQGFGFVPPARPGGIEQSHKVDELRRSVDSIQAELLKARERVQGLGSDSRDAVVDSARASTFSGVAGMYRESNGSAGTAGHRALSPLDDRAVLEKARQAQQIKERVAQISSTAKRAQDMTRTLQDKLHTLEGLRRQFQDLEMQIAEQRAAMSILERDRDQLRQEEQQSLEQVSDLEAAHYEYKSKLDDISQQLSQALERREQQRMSLDTTSRDCSLQTQGIVAELEQSRRNVSSLAASEQSKQQMIALLERKNLDLDENRRAQENIEREKMRAMLDETRRGLCGDRKALEQLQQLRQSAATSREEIHTRLAGVDSEVEYLSSALQSKGNEVYVDVKVDIDAKKRELTAHVQKVQGLEAQLQQNREQLSDLSIKIAELHEESRDKELAARRCEDVQAELQRKLEVHERAKAAEAAEREAGEAQVARAVQALDQVKSRWRELESQLAESRDGGSREASAVENEVKEKQHTLSEVQSEVQVLRGLCEELDSTSTSHRALVHDRRDALEVARARVNELTRQLSKASGEIAGSDSLLKRLGEDAATCSANLEKVRKELRERQDAVAVLQDETLRAGRTHSEAAVGLEETAASLQRDVDSLARSREESQKHCVEAEGSLAEHGEMLAQLQGQVDQLGLAKQQHESERDILLKEQQRVTDELQARMAEVANLEGATQACELDLTSTRSAITSKIRQAAELEVAHRDELARMESDMEALLSEQAESRQLHAQVSQELEECRKEHQDKLAQIASAEQEKLMLAAKLECARAGPGKAVEGNADLLKHTESRLGQITANCVNSARQLEEREAQLAAAEGSRQRISARLASIREDALPVVDELQVTRASLEQRQDELRVLQDIKQLQTSLKSVESAPLEVARLEADRAQLLAELSADELQLEERLKLTTLELDTAKTQAEHKQLLMLQKKGDELRQQSTQIDRLANEKSALQQQLQTLTAERSKLEDTIVQREQSHTKLSEEVHARSQECEALHQTMRQIKESSSQMSEREKALETTLATVQQKEESWRRELQEHATKMFDVKSGMESLSLQSESKIAGQMKSLEEHCRHFLDQKAEQEELEKEIDILKAEEAQTKRDSAALITRTEEIGQELVRARSELAETEAEREKSRHTMLEWSKQVKELQSTKGGKACTDSAGLPDPAELEEMLRQAGDRLVAANELLRARKAEEEELRSEVLKVKESISAAQDRLSYQVEHGNLQFETFQKLQEQKDRFEKEVELLTLGLHEEQQKVQYLQEANNLMQREIEGMDHSSMQEWATEIQRVKVATEVANYKEETELWKQKTDGLRKYKVQELGRLQRENETAVERLMDQISKTKAELDAGEQRFRRRAVAMEKYQKSGKVDAPSSAVPGLVVPQRPLPLGHQRRKALLIGINYTGSHAPLKGCINDVWNLQCLLRYTLQYSSDQLRMLLDGVDGRQLRSECKPTKANILSGLQWLTSGAQPGDSLLLAFAGYGTQHPRAPESGDQCEAYIVPSDFAADLPNDFFQQGGARPSTAASQRSMFGFSSWFGGSSSEPQQQTQKGYRLVSMLAIQDIIACVPKATRFTSLFDSCFSLIPNVHPVRSCSPAFARIGEGPETHAMLREVMPQPRYLQLPVLSVRHCPPLRPSIFPACWLYNFSACELHEWCGELPVEGTVQGAFTWAFLKAFSKLHFHCSVYQLQLTLTRSMAELKAAVRGIEQTPVLQLSQSAGMNDILIGT